MRILVVGGGSGGHVTPVAAVCNEIIARHSNTELYFWCDRAFESQARLTMESVPAVIDVSVISAGKLRRYHGLSIWQHIRQFRTIVLPNSIDAIKLTAGFVQSVFKLLRLKPDVVFTKGGFVCLPVGLAAKALSIPLVIHDSDAHPGLTNRVLAKFARTIATGAPLKHYSYPVEKSVYVGIPVSNMFKPLASTEIRTTKAKLGFDEHEPLVVVTGGGLGAQRINDAVMRVIAELASISSVALIAGQSHKALADDPRIVKLKNVQIHGYVAGEKMRDLLGSSDVTVTRAGATTLLELAALHKPTIIIPNDLLTGGHQTKNARVYEQASAAVIIPERELIERPLVLIDTISSILLNPQTKKKLSTHIATLARPNAARDMAQLILDAAKKVEA